MPQDFNKEVQQRYLDKVASIQKQQEENKEADKSINEWLHSTSKEAAKTRKYTGNRNPREGMSDAQIKQYVGRHYYPGIAEDIGKGLITSTNDIENLKLYRKFNPPNPEEDERSAFSKWLLGSGASIVNRPTKSADQVASENLLREYALPSAVAHQERIGALQASPVEQQMSQLFSQLAPQLLQQYNNPSALSQSLFPDAQQAQHGTLTGQLLNGLFGPQSLQYHVPQALSALNELTPEQIQSFKDTAAAPFQAAAGGLSNLKNSLVSNILSAIGK